MPPRPSSALMRYRPSVLPTSPTRPPVSWGSVTSRQRYPIPFRPALRRSVASRASAPFGLARRENPHRAPPLGTARCERPAPPISHTAVPPTLKPPSDKNEDSSGHVSRSFPRGGSPVNSCAHAVPAKSPLSRVPRPPPQRPARRHCRNALPAHGQCLPLRARGLPLRDAGRERPVALRRAHAL